MSQHTFLARSDYAYSRMYGWSAPGVGLYFTVTFRVRFYGYS